jgi:hypothetical protein
MASLDDVVTVQKNGVIAINNLAQTNNRMLGTTTTSVITASTLVISGAGYLVRYSILVAGVSGTINNSNSVANYDSSNALCATQATVGIFNVGMPFASGLVVNPGAGQSVAVTYSIG